MATKNIVRRRGNGGRSLGPARPPGKSKTPRSHCPDYGSVQAVFVVTATTSTLRDPYDPIVNFVPAKYFGSLVIDDCHCNGKPDAILLVTPRGKDWPYPGVGVLYDAKLRKWKIIIQPAALELTQCFGLGKPLGGSCGASYVGVLPPAWWSINPGDQFNVLIAGA